MNRFRKHVHGTVSALTLLALAASITFSSNVLAEEIAYQPLPIKPGPGIKLIDKSVGKSAVRGSISKTDEASGYDISNPDALPRIYFTNISGENYTIAARKVFSTAAGGENDASVYINDQEILRYRSALKGISPYQRAKQSAYVLYDFLRHGGSPAQIKPGMDGEIAVIRAGSKILATIDNDTAKEAKINDKQLTMLWLNQARESLGTIPLIREGSFSRGGFIIRTPDYDFNPEDFSGTGKFMTGMASWYGPGFHGRRAANGSRYDMNALTAAHKTLPFGTMVRVYNHRTGKACIVKITDRGPFIHGRIIDLSRGAAEATGLLGSGVAKVTIEVVEFAPKTEEPIAKDVPQDDKQVHLSE